MIRLEGQDIAAIRELATTHFREAVVDLEADS
jgi:hypothetical protein